MPSILLNTNRNNLDIVARGKIFPSIREAGAVAITFGFTVFAWIFFRARNIDHAFQYIATIFSNSLFVEPEFEGTKGAMVTMILVAFFMIIEWMGREREFAIQHLNLRWTKPVRLIFYYGVVIAIFVFTGKQQEFIYFQF